ncbi:hypothetical protein QQS21_001867 [Conoideocrella luteorostrata]|uniref:Uncharacterized protein n=1 Tax=Conoideocrella luteorostrata TaxID=1105319 RepID=A0AAJ0CW83_9HYPO|nr:hypothetical protein QQS21_001867 [Conoideocrella luteorostrata]
MTSAVLGFDHAHNNATSHRETSLHANNGVHNTWSEAFLSLLESVLRDAEDATISIQYERLRRHAGRFKHVLDEVKIPSLVIVDAGQDFNTLVGLPDHIEGWEMKGFAQRDDGIDWTSQQRHPATSSPSMPEPSGCSPVSGNNGKEELEHDTIPTPTLDIVSVPAVVGIQDWHNSVFGDPYFASVLSQDDNADVWAGLVYQFECSQSTGLCQILCWEKDSLHAQVRRLLYESYHAVVAIVTEFYRIEADSDDRELPARKRLLQALAKLDDIDGFGEDKYPRSDSIMSSAKRRRLE